MEVEMKEITPASGANGKAVFCEDDALMQDDNNGKTAPETEQDHDNNASSACTAVIVSAQNCVLNFYIQRKSTIKLIVSIVALLAYCAYIIYASYLDVKRAAPMLVITGLVIAWLAYLMLSRLLAQRFYSNVCMPLQAAISSKWHIIKWVLVAAVALLVIVLVVVTIGRRVDQYRGLFGLIFFLAILFLTSRDASKVNLRPVLWGLLMNFFFALFILKTNAGFVVFNFLANHTTTFLSYSDAGAMFVFDKNGYKMHFFAFKILPTIVFFSCVISLLYYIGVMQFIIQKIALVMQITMGTTATESLCCAGNIFVGQTEAPILIRPFLADMTNSEIHAVLTGGFATIAGGVLAAYINMGIDPSHLIAASVMNAPMALAVSKLSYPQIKRPKYLKGQDIVFAKPTEQNLVEAAAAGASQSIGLVANIAANIIAFLALLAFVNAALSWIGSLVDYPELSFEVICSYLFWLVAFLMGVESKDCFSVAELIGTKLVINEFVAYEKLSDLIAAEAISKKSEVIATYALCGFANLSSVGVQLGGIGAMVPSRRSDLAKLVMRALFAGSVATLMTACLAGILITEYTDEMIEIPSNVTGMLNSTTTAYTNSTQL